MTAIRSTSRRSAVLKFLAVMLTEALSVRTARATAHAAVGVLTALASGVVFSVFLILWWASAFSLISGPTEGLMLPILYALITFTSPVALLWLIWEFGVLHRARFRAVLQVDIPAPPRSSGSFPWKPVRLWLRGATWRQAGYALVALIVGGVGGVVVVGCWVGIVGALGWALTGEATNPVLIVTLALVGLLVAPWLSIGLAKLDAVLGTYLLGPSRTEAMALRIESLTRSRADIVTATDAERRRIERDLHDGAQQRLVSLAMNLGMAREMPSLQDEARAVIADAHDEAVAALAELREFVRGLHPAVLNDRGLDAALSGAAARAPFPVALRVELTDRCSPSIEAIAYFVVSEALTNVAKHASASRAEVALSVVGDRLRVRITDDGRGGAIVEPAGGLNGLAGRAAAVDGTMTVESPVGGPTTITVELPCE